MNCEHIGDPIRIDGLCIDCWKARAEKAESALKNALEVSGKYEDRWHAEKQLREKAEAELDAYKKRVESSENDFEDEHNARVRSESACAEMRLILQSFHNDVASGEISPSEPFVALLEHALSSDVGKGWVPPDEAERLRRINRDNDAVINDLTAKLAIAVEALEKIANGLPAFNEGSFIIEHHSGDGEYIGCENVDPVGLAYYLNQQATEALSKLKEDKA